MGRQVFSNGKMRIESGQSHEPGGVLIIDGETAKSYSPTGKLATIQRTPTQPLPQGCDYRETFMAISGSVTLDYVLQKRTGWLCKQTADEIVLEIEPKNSPASIQDEGFRIVCDKKHGTMPRLIEWYGMDKGERRHRRVLMVDSFHEAQPGVWVPVKARTTTFVLGIGGGKDIKGEPGNRVTMAVDVRRSRWNANIPSEAFEFTVPAGTKIVDAQRDLLYSAGVGEPSKNLEQLAANAKDLVSIKKPDPAESKRSHMLLWILVASGSFLFFVLGLWWVRKRNRTLLLRSD